MLRRILGFAVLAVVAWLLLKIVFGLLGTLIGLAVTALILAFIGYAIYLVLRLVAPGVADRVRDMITGAASAAREPEHMG
jgi:hypothetical protein